MGREKGGRDPRDGSPREGSPEWHFEPRLPLKFNPFESLRPEPFFLSEACFLLSSLLFFFFSSCLLPPPLLLILLPLGSLPGVHLRVWAVVSASPCSAPVQLMGVQLCLVLVMWLRELSLREPSLRRGYLPSLRGVLPSCGPSQPPMMRMPSKCQKVKHYSEVLPMRRK